MYLGGTVRVVKYCNFCYICNMKRRIIFFVFDEDKIVVLFNGFQKKTQKTPDNEIKKALRIKDDYYEYKRKYDSGL